MDGWWKKHPFYIEYMIHEWTAFFVAAYALTLDKLWTRHRQATGKKPPAQ